MKKSISNFGNESIYLEYKESIPTSNSLAKTMISLSNTKGGKIILGIKDKTHEIIGIKPTIDIEEYVMNIASENCDPIISPIVEFHSIDKHLIIIIDIPTGTLKPYHLKNKPIEQSTYIRIGSTNRLADKNHMQKLLREAVNETFDRLPINNTNIHDIDLKKVEKYQELKLKRVGTPKENITKKYLNKIGVIAKKNDSYEISYGGMLVFGKNLNNISQLQRANVKVGRFAGSSLGDIIDHDLISGTIDKQIGNTCDFIRKHNFISGEIKGLKRTDNPTYPIAAIREIVTNALIHRDYSEAYCKAIQCRIFDDRLEIESPGLLPIGVKVDNLGDVQNTRNPLLAKFLFEMSYFDEWGQGIRRIKDACRENNNPPPLFEEKDTSFQVTLFPTKLNRQYSIKERKKLLINYLKSEKTLQSNEYQKITGISSAQAAKDFAKFIKEKIIIKKGEKRGVKYYLK